jgi:two-component system, OmpR family, sensor histidine kinase BaeS
VEWGINLSKLIEKLTSFLPVSFFWRLTFLYFLVIGVALFISGWALYNTACFLAAGVGNLDELRQQQFNQTLLSYVWLFVAIAIFIASALYFYLTKRLLKPIRSLLEATQLLKKGKYPNPIPIVRTDEIGQLVQQYNELIAQLNRNEADRKKLVSDISHEFRTPLSNLSGYLMALESGDIDGDQKLYTALYQESQRLTSLLDQFDQLKQWDQTTAKTSTRKEIASIKPLLEQCTSMFQWTLKQANMQLKLHVEAADLFIHSEGIQQVVRNLLDNAIQYYKGSGTIRIHGSKEGAWYSIAVSGPGVPIPEREKDKIFERFYRLESSRSRDTGGAGLGLAIAKEIVEKHHGKICVAPSSCGENTFYVKLPLKREMGGSA